MTKVRSEFKVDSSGASVVVGVSSCVVVVVCWVVVVFAVLLDVVVGAELSSPEGLSAQPARSAAANNDAASKYQPFFMTHNPISKMYYSPAAAGNYPKSDKAIRMTSIASLCLE